MPRALLSVSDKTGLVEFARRLAALRFELVSTGGTARALREAGLEVLDVSEVTGFPEMLDGRVKTLHPKVHGGLLGRVGLASHRQAMAEHGIAPWEIAVVNLYPFEEVAARPEAGLDELIENIDIGGPAMLRSAAKNAECVTVICDPADYAAVAAELESAGATSAATRRRLARKVFARTAAYDAAIAATLAEREGEAGALPEFLSVAGRSRGQLRYGENPQQQAALYTRAGQRGGVAQGELLQGKELSFNNLVDLDAAWELAAEFDTPAVAIIKHTNPAGCATAATQVDAWRAALECDPVSAFGGVIGLNRPLEGDAAKLIAELFVECIAAPGFTASAREALAGKKNLRLVQVAPLQGPDWQLRSISGGWLVQTADRALWREGKTVWDVVTRRAPSEEEADALRFGWAVCRHVKSNAIVFARPGQTLAVGAGQMSRVDSVRIAGLKARLPLQGAAVASDAFFPFPDGIEEAARLGATAVVQPGGSVRDADAIAACDRLGLAMVFTGQRHFWH